MMPDIPPPLYFNVFVSYRGSMPGMFGWLESWRWSELFFNAANDDGPAHLVGV